MNNIKLLYYDRIDVSERIDVNKTSESKECDTCHYWYFLNKAFKFQPNVCNGCHDLLMMSMNYSDIAILNMKGAGYCCIISSINKSEAINLMENIDLNLLMPLHKMLPKTSAYVKSYDGQKWWLIRKR